MKQSRLVWIAVSIVAVAYLVVAAGSASAAGATRYVAKSGSDADNDCRDSTAPCLTLQYAVNVADADDTISVGAGTYAESLRVRISLSIIGAGADKTTVTGVDGPGILVDGTDTATAPIVTVRSLASSGNLTDDGFHADAATLTLSQVAASDNDGAGVEAIDSTVHVGDSALTGNHDVGATLTGGTLTVADSAVSGNDGGGVVDESGTVQVESSTVSANVGAGVVADGDGASVAVTSSTITGTTPFTDGGEAFGGGVVVFADSSARVTESTLYGNTNFGMAVIGGSGQIVNSTVSATAKGPVDEPDLQGGLVYTSITTAALGAAPRPLTGSVASPGLTSIGTVDAGNHTPDCVGAIVDGGYNLDDDGSCKLAAAGSRSHASAQLGPLTANGGPTATVLPGVSSAARNAIPVGSAGCVAGAVDQRGLPRRSPSSGSCDIGSVEAVVVDPTLHAKVVGGHRHHGWRTGRVKVKFTCQAGSAPLTHPCPSPSAFHSSGRDLHVTKTITGVDGGTATVTVQGIKIDNAKPRIKVKGVTPGHTYHSEQAIHPTCSDSLSGIAACTVRAERHGSVVRYVVTARDKAGNVRTKHGEYFLRH